MKVTLIFILAVLAVYMISCREDADPLPSVTHPEGWMDSNADNFHGKKNQAVGSETCKSCHGDDLSGGTSGVACSSCHTNYPHPPSWSTPGSNESHAAYLKANNWNLGGCKVCHGEDYRGGSSNVSCYTCHPEQGGPEACNTCHGTGAAPVSDPKNWAPPKDLDDNINPDAPGVGLHQMHLNESLITSAYERTCNLCHPALSGFDDPRHINGIVDIEFSEVADWHGKVNPVYNADSYECSNVYCHGNFTFRRDDSDIGLAYIDSVMVGNNPVLKWPTTQIGQKGCLLCHEVPPTGHIQVANCSSCHSAVVDAEYNIINTELHINGEKNLQD